MNDKIYKLNRYGTLTINNTSKLTHWKDNNGQEIIFDYLLSIKKASFKKFVLNSINWLCDRYLFNNK